jgi:hypothetical protein
MDACTLNARRTSPIVAALVAAIGTGVLPRVGSAQRAAGSVDVALTVLPRVAPQSVTVTRFRIDRDGMATFRAAFPTTSGSSQLFVTRVASPDPRFAAVRLLPDIARSASGTDIGAREVAYRFELSRLADSDSPHEVHLRLECLVLPGT